MGVKLSDAPGCVGSPLIRSNDHPVCLNCAFRSVCAGLAKRNEERLKQELGVEDLKIAQSRPEPAPPANTPRQSPTGVKTIGLNKKGAELLKSIAARGYDLARLRETLDAGDPLALDDLKPEYAKLALRALATKPMNKTELRILFETDLGWGKLTAQSHVSIFANAMTNLGLVSDKAGILEIEAA